MQVFSENYVWSGVVIQSSVQYDIFIFEVSEGYSRFGIREGLGAMFFIIVDDVQFFVRSGVLYYKFIGVKIQDDYVFISYYAEFS